MYRNTFKRLLRERYNSIYRYICSDTEEANIRRGVGRRMHKRMHEHYRQAWTSDARPHVRMSTTCRHEPRTHERTHARMSTTGRHKPRTHARMSTTCRHEPRTHTRAHARTHEHYWQAWAQHARTHGWEHGTWSKGVFTHARTHARMDEPYRHDRYWLIHFWRCIGHLRGVSTLYLLFISVDNYPNNFPTNPTSIGARALINSSSCIRCFLFLSEVFFFTNSLKQSLCLSSLCFSSSVTAGWLLTRVQRPLLCRPLCRIFCLSYTV